MLQKGEGLLRGSEFICRSALYINQLGLLSNFIRGFDLNHEDRHSNVSLISLSSSEFNFNKVATALVNCCAWKVNN